MNREINISVSEDLNLSADVSRIGFEQENNATILKIAFTEAQLQKKIFLDLQLPDGIRIRTTKLIPDENGTASYLIPGAITSKRGILQMQLIFEDTQGCVGKSQIIALELSGSINAEDDIHEEVTGFTAAAQEALDRVNDVILAHENGEFDGASAYETAVLGGYMGSEEEFSLLLASAQENVIENIKVNGTKVEPTSKTVDITVPQNTVSSNEIMKITLLTQSDYDEIESPLPSVLYIIVRED